MITQQPYKSSTILSRQLNIPASTIRRFRNKHGIKTKGKLSHVSKEEFISNYHKLKSQEKMAKFYNVDHHTINDFSKKIGFDDSIYKRTVINKNQEDIIIKNYNQKSSLQLAKEMNLTQSAINGIWYRNGLRNKVKRKYLLTNENYFENIDSQDKAYFLGFIGADGCIYETKYEGKQNILRISIQKQDVKILNILKQFLGTDKPILEYTNNKNTYVSLEISSNKIFDDIENTGLSTKKTYSNTIANVSNDLMPALIRGYFDGDGTISNHKNVSRANISIVGYESNLQKIKNFLDRCCIYGSISECNSKKYSIAEDGSKFCIYNLANKTSRYCFLKLIYEDSQNIFLDRKYIKSKQYIDLIEQSENIRDRQIVNYYKYAVQKVS